MDERLVADMSNPQKIPVTIVLPSLNPDEKLTAVLYELREAGFVDRIAERA